ncbi:hypothetical protein LWI29_031563 [Acer saccharum]|uniref:S-protein homolog n=1 Tax=Acer saccharum TaxID=4024 RepID=A0AA39THW1_ACESA|nr:hypothetical protein LWI29_031563 [Acer saccharum]
MDLLQSEESNINLLLSEEIHTNIPTLESDISHLKGASSAGLLILAMATSISPVALSFEVFIFNILGTDTNLNVHCKSSFEDLGTRVLEREAHFNWSFGIGKGSTAIYYECDMSYDNVTGHFLMFDEQRDASRCGDQSRRLIRHRIRRSCHQWLHQHSSLPLVIWCSSGDSDLGGRALQEGDDFSWSLTTTNFFWGSSTSSNFLCTMKWDAKRKRFDAFNLCGSIAGFTVVFGVDDGSGSGLELTTVVVGVWSWKWWWWLFGVDCDGLELTMVVERRRQMFFQLTMVMVWS